MPQNTEISCIKNLFQSPLDLGLGWRFTIQQDRNTEHTAKMTNEWFLNNFLTAAEWRSQIPDLNPVKHLWRLQKMAIYWHLPSSLKELKMAWRRNAREAPHIILQLPDVYISSGMYPYAVLSKTIPDLSNCSADCTSMMKTMNLFISSIYLQANSHTTVLTCRMLTTFLARKGPGLEAWDIPTPV